MWSGKLGSFMVALLVSGTSELLVVLICAHNSPVRTVCENAVSTIWSRERMETAKPSSLPHMNTELVAATTSISTIPHPSLIATPQGQKSSNGARITSRAGYGINSTLFSTRPSATRS